MKILKVMGYAFSVLLLTILTQVGGVVFIVSSLVAARLKFRFRKLVSFVVLYVVATFIIVPMLASVMGREPIGSFTNVKPGSYLTILLNRNYVTPKLNQTLKNISDELAQTSPSIKLQYLDACFPFINKFPLLPHLSHNDGKKIDFCLVYEDEDGEVKNRMKSISGYGVFEKPEPNEFNQTAFCKKKGYWQYDFPKYLTLGAINTNLQFSPNGNRMVLDIIIRNKAVQKVFVERHLLSRINLSHPKLRFQGCGAVRHDDHIHMQIY
ncbi:hypothetical protein [Labilibacter marinus]|uniref:hypothetical protein n=1 Tax=Labilibacter marinus TaxID=1477105 RepID=UPI00083248F8|nr:hypothetical protein [Labilibacter marinus]